MRRVIGIVTSAAFALTLCCGIARASSPFDAAPPASNLASQVMMRLFGETSDSSASFAAVRGDRTGESPLRQLALRLPSTPESASFVTEDSVASSPAPQTMASSNVSDLERALSSGLFRADDSFSAPPGSTSSSTLAPQPSALLTAAYQPVSPIPDISPAPGTLAFDSVTKAATPSAIAPLSAHVGPVSFQADAGGNASETPALSLHDNTSTAGANFQVRALKRNINLDVNTQYEHLMRNDSSSFTPALNPSSAWQLPGADAPLVIPSYADLNRVSLGAGVAVPVLRGMTLNLNYGIQHLYGGYGLPGLYNLDTVNNTYGGKLTFNIPDATKTLSISAYQERFNDSVLPNNGLTQTREDVNFTVKF